MAGSFVIGGSNGVAASSTTATISATYVAGDRIVVDVRYTGAVNINSVSDGSAFSQIGSYVDDSQGNRLARFERIGVGAGTVTITVTFASAVTNREVAWLRGLGLDSNPAQDTKGQNQDAVAASTDAVTSTSLTPTSQPNIVMGTTCTRFFAVAISAGTSFTSLGALSGWDSMAGDTSLVEYRRTTSTSAVAATFTPGGAGDYFHTIASVFGEAASGGATTTKVMSEAITVADTPLRVAYRVRVPTDTTLLTDGTVPMRRLRRVIDEATSLIDSVVKNVISAGATTYTKVMTDTLSVTDGFFDWLRRVRNQLDTITLTEGGTFRTSIITATESIDLTDDFVSWRRLKRVAQDNIDLIDGFSKTLAGVGITYAKVMSDTVTLIDDAGQRWKRRVTQLTDVTILSDQAIRYIQRIRVLGDVVEYSDGVVKIRRSIRSVDEGIDVTDGSVSTLYRDQISSTSFSFGSSGPPFRFGGA